MTLQHTMLIWRKCHQTRFMVMIPLLNGKHTLNVFHDHKYDEDSGNWGSSTLVKEEGRRTLVFLSGFFALGSFDSLRENDTPNENHVNLYIWVYTI